MSTVGYLILARQPCADVMVDLRMLHIAGKHSIKQDLLPAVNVVFSWVPLLHQKVSNIKASDLRAMQQQMYSQMKNCDKLVMTLHADVWTDPWERH